MNILIIVILIFTTLVLILDLITSFHVVSCIDRIDNRIDKIEYDIHELSLAKEDSISDKYIQEDNNI